MDDETPIVKSTSPWLAAITCGALVAIAGASGAIIMRTQILMQVSADAARARSTLTDLQNRVTTLESQTATLAQAAQPDPAPLNALRSGLDTTGKQLADLTARIDTLEKKPALVVTAAPAPAPASAGSMSATSYASLASAVRSGAPFADALAAWKHDHSVTPDAIAPLEQAAASGVPSDSMLRSQLQAALVTISPNASGDDGHGLIDRVNTHLAGLVSIKKQSADNYDTLRADVATAEIATLKREILQLPPQARAPFAAWLAAVQTHDEALAALVSLAALPPKAAVAP
jgi:BMFP domain-containing protein YqiC